MRVALYARVATQCQASKGLLASQVEELRIHAKERGYAIAEDYLCYDDGCSGMSWSRPQLDRLRSGAQAGVFDAVLVRSPDRLSRNGDALFLLLAEFTRWGTPVLFLEQPLADSPQPQSLVARVSVIHE